MLMLFRLITAMIDIIKVGKSIPGVCFHTGYFYALMWCFMR